MAIAILRKKDGTPVYQVKVKDRSGKWFPTPCFQHLDQAKTEEARLWGLKRRGTQALSQDAKRVTVREYWEVWKLENRQAVSEGWKISQDQMYRDYVDPVLGRLRLAEVGIPEVGRCLSQARSDSPRCEGGRLSDNTRKHVYSLLRRLFGDAVEYYEMLPVSPVRPKFHRPKVREVKRRFLVPEDAFRLLEACRETYLGPPTWLMVLSALRISEVQALRWRSVESDRGQILIQAAFNNKTGRLQAYPKQEDWAYVPVPPLLSDYLSRRGAGPEAFVAPGPDGVTMLSYETYLRALGRLCQRVGVTVVTPHELRHTSTEIWIRAGASHEDIRRLLNHQSLSATKHYIHRTDERLTELGARLELVPAGSSFQKSFQIWKEKAVCQGEEEVSDGM